MGSQQACQKPGYIRMARGDRVRVAPRTGGTQLQCSTLHQWRAINYPGRSQAFDEHGACRRPPRVRGEHESRVAVLLAEGKTVRDVAAATGRLESTIRTHVKHMFAKHRLSRQADLVRLVRSLAGVPKSRR